MSDVGSQCQSAPQCRFQLIMPDAPSPAVAPREKQLCGVVISKTGIPQKAVPGTMAPHRGPTVSEGTHIGTEGRDTTSTQCQGQGSRAGPSCSSGRRAESWPTAGKPVCLGPSADVQPEPATSFCAGRRTSLVVFVVPGSRGWHEAPVSSEVACGSPVQVVFVVPAVMGSPFPRLGRHHSE